MGRSFCKSHYFPLLISSFLSLISFAFSLSTVSISETSNLTLVCALLPSFDQLNKSSLSCSTFPGTGFFLTPFDSNVSFTGIVSGDGFLCGLRPSFSLPNVSVIHCLRFFNNNGTTMEFKRIYSGPPLTQLEAGNYNICGLNETKSLESWQWPDFNQNQTRGNQNFSSIAVGEGFVCGLLSDNGKISCHGNVDGMIDQEPRGNNYNVIAAGFSHACAINRDNDLQCWGNTVIDDTPRGKFNALALGLNRSCALRTNGTVVCWGQNNFSLPRELERNSFITIKAKRNVFCGVSTLDYSLFCWGDDARFNSSSMVFSKVLPGPCRSTCPCGTVSGSGSFCSNDESICKACVTIMKSVPSLQSQNRSTSSDLNGKMVAFLVVGSVGSLSLLLVVSFFVFRYCKGRGCRVHDSGPLDQTGISDKPKAPQVSLAPSVLEKRLSQLRSLGKTSRLEEFSLEVLIQATNNFSQEHKIGTGSFGYVYRATFNDGREVAIKRAEITSASSYATGTKRQEDKDIAFVNELEYLSRLHHKSLVRLLGFCEDSDEHVLIYEYVNNGTLHDHLHKHPSSSFMSWAIRLKTALDVARGIEYLHEYAVPPIIHRDIKTSNILLDASWTAKVSDFGLSLIGPDEDESHLSLRAAGTVGYMDPEYYRLQRLTNKSDVYSFGVVLLELLSGLKAIHHNENGVLRYVVDFVVPYIVRDEIHRVLDRRVPAPTLFEIEGVASVGRLAADCVRAEGRDRPSMFEIVKCLEKALNACLRPQTLSRSSTESSM